MYKRLHLNRTKHNYREILNSVILETEELMRKFPQLSMYKIIYDQLKDIKNNILPNKNRLTEDEIYNRYNFGAIAAKNFDLDSDEYAQKLSDTFGGLFDYFTMPEK